MPFLLRLLLAITLVCAFAFVGLAHVSLRKQLDLALVENDMLKAEARALRQQLEAERILAAAIAAKTVPHSVTPAPAAP